MAHNEPFYSTDSSNPPRPSASAGGGVLLLLIAVLGFMLAIIFVPGIRGSLKGLFAASSSPRMNPRVIVWTEKRTGNYYCAGSLMYGHHPGTLMKQGEALTVGFQPSLDQYCRR